MNSSDPLIERAKEKLLIDKYNLDDALQEHPSLYWDICEEYIQAVSKRDEAYENIKTVSADLNVSIRQMFESEGKKCTEAMITNAVLSAKPYKEAVEKHLSLKEEAAKLGALKDSFEQRSYVLKSLVELYIAGYFTKETYFSKPKREEKSSKQMLAEDLRAKLIEKRRNRASNRTSK